MTPSRDGRPSDSQRAEKFWAFAKPFLAAHKAAGGQGHFCNSGNFRHGCVTHSAQPPENPARPIGPRRRLYRSGKPRENAFKRRSSLSPMRNRLAILPVTLRGPAARCPPCIFDMPLPVRRAVIPWRHAPCDEIHQSRSVRTDLDLFVTGRGKVTAHRAVELHVKTRKPQTVQMLRQRSDGERLPRPSGKSRIFGAFRQLPGQKQFPIAWLLPDRFVAPELGAIKLGQGHRHHLLSRQLATVPTSMLSPKNSWPRRLTGARRP